MAEHVGEIPCPKCGNPMSVSSDKRGFLYLACKEERLEPHWLTGQPTVFKGCGVDKTQTHGGQNIAKRMWLKANPAEAKKYLLPEAIRLVGEEKARQFLGLEEPAPAAPEPEVSQSEPEPEPAPVLDDSPSDPPASPPPDSPKKRPFFGSRPLFSANKRKGAA